ncbi:hypothetical protein PHIN3_203 [Sinorhizobium phage phiN3]|uniref:Uncharacterized protein n=1 Tax=Sinorhizobium phage phiN3 TaxID=1647405 RepID=A0A0F6YR24_9CAUD|nr:hypothetical protein AVT40_gp330 [Sinorhizobium phage phiN3]AKF13466.1 hypothetical protein PHIN3_203 [Sinorhizobium phage phiN3]
MKSNKVILTDVDGVLLDWIGSFEKYMNTAHNLYTVDDTSYRLDKRFGAHPDKELFYIEDFNHSPEIGNLLPHKDAVEGVRRFVEEGYKFLVITSLSKNDSSCRARVENLEREFGADAFEDFVFLDIGERKNDVLAKFEGSGYPWVEDLPKNALDGHSIGLKTYLMKHTYNADFAHDEMVFVNNWKEISKDLANL